MGTDHLVNSGFIKLGNWVVRVIGNYFYRLNEFSTGMMTGCFEKLSSCANSAVSNASANVQSICIKKGRFDLA